ncbi:protein kinase [Myxococcaceae bacterium GXIMD 01537]
MSAMEFKIPKGAILFSAGGYQYEFREDLGEAHDGISLFLARRRTPEGHPRGKVLLKAVGLPREEAGARVTKARAKLEEQTRLAMHLRHPGILRVHGLHKAEGCWYVIAEHPAGNSLNDLLTLVSECKRWFSPSFALYVGAQVANALEHAHTAKDEIGRPLGIVHRAIDPEHVFMDWNGAVQVADFGLALSDLPGRLGSTVRRPQGDVLYSSPEMLLSGRVDARSDLFALGVVMLELATGKLLLYAPDGVSEAVKGTLSVRQSSRVKRAIKRARLAGSTALAVDAIWRAATYTQEDLESLTEGLPQSLRVPLCKLLQPSPADRYQTARELALDLNRWLGGQFGANEAEAEVRSAERQAAEAMFEMDLRRSRRPPDELSTN